MMPRCLTRLPLGPLKPMGPRDPGGPCKKDIVKDAHHSFFSLSSVLAHSMG